jgi:hypothetical protein
MGGHGGLRACDPRQKSFLQMRDASSGSDKTQQPSVTLPKEFNYRKVKIRGTVINTIEL